MSLLLSCVYKVCQGFYRTLKCFTEREKGYIEPVKLFKMVEVHIKHLLMCVLVLEL